MQAGLDTLARQLADLAQAAQEGPESVAIHAKASLQQVRHLQSSFATAASEVSPGSAGAALLEHSFAQRMCCSLHCTCSMAEGRADGQFPCVCTYATSSLLTQNP